MDRNRTAVRRKVTQRPPKSHFNLVDRREGARPVSPRCSLGFYFQYGTSRVSFQPREREKVQAWLTSQNRQWNPGLASNRPAFTPWRSEEHTSELQSRENLVCR